MSRRDERKREAERRFAEASDLQDAGRLDAAIQAYRAAARLGNVYAQSNLASLLADQGRSGEAVYWLKRAVRAGFDMAAWNLAMHYRELGRRRWHLHWLHVAASLGGADAIDAIRELQAQAGQTRASGPARFTWTPDPSWRFIEFARCDQPALVEALSRLLHAPSLDSVERADYRSVGCNLLIFVVDGAPARLLQDAGDGTSSLDLTRLTDAARERALQALEAAPAFERWTWPGGPASRSRRERLPRSE